MSFMHSNGLGYHNAVGEQTSHKILKKYFGQMLKSYGSRCENRSKYGTSLNKPEHISENYYRPKNNCYNEKRCFS